MKQYLFGFINLVGISSILRRQKVNTITVLSLHRISDEKDYFWNPITPAAFEKLLQYVIKYYTVISFADISFIEERPSPKPYLILSFDDGYYDFYEHALPLLKKYNLPANHNIVNNSATNNQITWTQRLNTIFNFCKQRDINLSFKTQVSTTSFKIFNKTWMKFYLEVYNAFLKIPKTQRLHLLAEKEKELSLQPLCKMMNWQQIIECSESGIEIGCHTYSHDVLSTISDKNILKKEIIVSALEIEKKINKKVEVLALPNGRGNDDLQEVIAGSNMKYILFVEDQINGVATFQPNAITNVYRINLTNESLAEMILRIELFHTKIRKYV